MFDFLLQSPFVKYRDFIKYLEEFERSNITLTLLKRFLALNSRVFDLIKFMVSMKMRVSLKYEEKLDERLVVQILKHFGVLKYLEDNNIYLSQ